MVLNVVKKAEQKITNDPNENKVCPCATHAKVIKGCMSIGSHRKPSFFASLARKRIQAWSFCVIVPEPLSCMWQEYLGITGNPKFNALSAQLAFGEHSPVIREARNATVQCLSGTGSLRVSHLVGRLRISIKHTRC